MKLGGDIYPIILAAGYSPGMLDVHTRTKRYSKNWFQIAVYNCTGLATPVVVLGWEAEKFKQFVPEGVEIVINKRWELGQISSLLAGLNEVPTRAPFMIYPVDRPNLRRKVVQNLAESFARRATSCQIVMPMHRGHAGHPAILSSSLRKELEGAATARHVVYRDPRRVNFVETSDSSILRSGHPVRRKNLKSGLARAK